MEGNNLRNVVESDAETFYVVYVACGYSVEFFEYMFLVLFGNADAVIGYFEDGKTRFSTGGDSDMRFAVGVFDGVVDEVV